MRHARLFLALTLLSLVGILSISRVNGQEAETKPQTAETGTYVGAEECAACHEQEMDALKKTPHGQAAFALRSSHACETCHGPGQAHVDSGGEPGTIRSFASLKSEESAEVCLACHEKE